MPGALGSALQSACDRHGDAVALRGASGDLSVVKLAAHAREAVAWRDARFAKVPEPRG